MVRMQRKAVVLFSSLVVAVAGLAAYINFIRALNIGWVYWAAGSAVVVLAIIMAVERRNAGTRATADFETDFHRKMSQDPLEREIIQRNAAYHIKKKVEAVKAAEDEVKHYMDTEVCPRATLNDNQANQAQAQLAKLRAAAKKLRNEMERLMQTALRNGLKVLNEIEYLNLA